MLLLINIKGIMVLKTNIAVLLPLSTYQKKIGKLIASKLDMFFADVDELLQFDFSDIKKVLSVGGKEFLEKEENKVVKRLASYSNTLITMPFSTFIREENLQVLKEHTLIVYLKFTMPNYIKMLKKEKKEAEFNLEEKVFAERDQLLEKYSDIIVPCENANKNDIVKVFLQDLNNYFN